MVIVGIAAHERQLDSAAALALVGDHQAEDVGVEFLQQRFVVGINAHVSQPGVDGSHDSYPPFPGRY